ncbi:unnamed protein product [Protopolystoma xenopodis]|uniref:Uncharacterized protein n=1 Tax=Protopolystoma xenopodis TaxID=117903 RepID=A0A3S5FBP3_9PLAT|nr:unnamed protein product [Protopolystoma xenopodis]
MRRCCKEIVKDAHAEIVPMYMWPSYGCDCILRLSGRCHIGWAYVLTCSGGLLSLLTTALPLLFPGHIKLRQGLMRSGAPAAGNLDAVSSSCSLVPSAGRLFVRLPQPRDPALAGRPGKHGSGRAHACACVWDWCCGWPGSGSGSGCGLGSGREEVDGQASLRLISAPGRASAAAGLRRLGGAGSGPATGDHLSDDRASFLGPSPTGSSSSPSMAAAAFAGLHPPQPQSHPGSQQQQPAHHHSSLSLVLPGAVGLSRLFVGAPGPAETPGSAAPLPVAGGANGPGSVVLRARPLAAFPGHEPTAVAGPSPAAPRTAVLPHHAASALSRRSVVSLHQWPLHSPLPLHHALQLQHLADLKQVSTLARHLGSAFWEDCNSS